MKLEVDLPKIKAIARKEFMDNLRNRWIVVLTAIFIILTLVISFVQGGGGLSGADMTVFGMLAIASMLVPIIAIMLGYNTISGEAETGSLLVVLSSPIRRLEVMVGKFIGLGSVLSTSILLGFGISGAAIISQDASKLAGYMIFIALTIMLGLIYLSLSICFSALLRRTVTSLGAGIGLFFWAMIIGSVVMGIYLATGGTFAEMGVNMPDWMWTAMIILSPTDMYQTSVMLGFGMSSFHMMGFSIEVPEFITLARLLVVYAVWISVSFAAGCRFMNRRDL